MRSSLSDRQKFDFGMRHGLLRNFYVIALDNYCFYAYFLLILQELDD